MKYDKRICILVLAITTITSFACNDSGAKTSETSPLNPFDAWDTPVFDQLAAEPDGAGNALVGTWSLAGDDPETIAFKSDDKFTETQMDEVSNGDWSVSGRMLSLHYKYKDEDGAEEWIDTLPFAIVDDTLYLYAMWRTDGSGAGLDGTWQYAARFSAAGSYPNEHVQEAESIELTVTIQGDTFEYSYTYDDEYHASDEEEQEDDTSHEVSSGSGDIIEQDGLYYFDITEFSGTEISCFIPDCIAYEPDDAPPGLFLGYPVADNVIAWAESDIGIENLAYIRQ